MKQPIFLNRDGDFRLEQAENTSALYFPLAGEAGLKSAITPNLGGDSKLNQETFVLEPVSVDNLHNNRSTRNFWLITEAGCWSATGVSAEQEAAKFTDRQDSSSVTAGLMWHRTCRAWAAQGLTAEITSFVPVRRNVEAMKLVIRNASESERRFTAAAAIPLYGRSADNLRDHRNVTAMLHRIRTTDNGVLVTPTMSFDEKGHRRNTLCYFAVGVDGEGRAPERFYPTVDSLIGEGGTFLHPRAILEDRPGVPAGTEIDGREAAGGLRFGAVTLQPGARRSFIVLLGVAQEDGEVEEALACLGSEAGFDAALEETRDYWQNAVNVRYHTGDERFDNFMRWVSFQPFLRRIYGCSFLPHHDYGRGGRGWRDLWQDCLSLLLMQPDDVRSMIVANFGGVRMDGTNATIIGSGLGSFIADRNGIARVWMDHALWPLMTTKFYIDQTGDIAILDEQAGYFKDPQCMRGTDIDERWTPEYGAQQRTQTGRVYEGSLVEHLLIQHLTAFLEVGEHNIFRLRGADWNDALDMAAHRGESVAFTCAYVGNLRDLAAILRQLSARSGSDARMLAEEIGILLRPVDYDDVRAKGALLSSYAQQCRHRVSGRQNQYSLTALADVLEERADWLMAHLRSQEWLGFPDGEGWFNSYYDDNGRAVEGMTDKGVRMMLTGQVFAVMSGTASEEQVRAITKAADHYLYRREIGGYRLNTDFRELKFDMGRMFGFAYGEKENGAVFSHMTVMYANALYRRGFVSEGYKALQTLADAALDFETGRIYPGIPEYFNADGRGVYHYLTGAASWYMMTVITQVFGVRGELGNLVIEPKLMPGQYDENGMAAMELVFAGKALRIVLRNEKLLAYGKTAVQSISLNGQMLACTVAGGRAEIDRAVIEAAEDRSEILVTLG